METASLSVVLTTHNEEANLARCLSSVGDLAQEIVVVDGASTDRTVSIAKKFHARIISTTNKLNFHINKKMGLEAARGQWLLQLDADEYLSPKLRQEIRQVITDPASLDGYWIPRKNYFLGRFLTKGGQYPDYTLRLYRQGKGTLPAKDVHEQAVVSGTVGFLTADLMHLGTPDFENYLSRFNTYSSLLADQWQTAGIRLGLFNHLKYFWWLPLKEFFLIYFRHRGYVDGFPGFIFALFSALRFPVTYIKLWQASFPYA